MEVGQKIGDDGKEKMGFEETELRLGLPGGGGGGDNTTDAVVRKRGFFDTVDLKLNLSSNDPAKPSAAKAQVVGWPPVRSFRKNTLAAFVKVSMDGAPYLRKVDLRMYKTYQQLSDALAKMFTSFTIGDCGSQGILKDFMNESKLMDLLNNSDYVPTYEDKDGDWMLVGDVPWEMFIESCKKLRIMKGTEAIGLAPRAMEKCKNRS